MKYDLAALKTYGSEQINAIHLDLFEYTKFGRLALVELGIAPFNFVSACIAMASILYYKEAVYVHEPFPLNHFEHGRLDSR